jgi:regulator of RNase E activity RraA
VIVGDANGLTVVPVHLADELTDLREGNDEIEGYLALRVDAAKPLARPAGR